MGELINLEKAKSIVEKAKSTGARVVFTNGCFDLLHPGHIECLRVAKELGDILIVGLNSDSSVRGLKGPERPILSESARALILCAIRYVDYVVIFSESTPQKVIETLKPGIIVKGGDYKPDAVVGHEVVEKEGGCVVIVPQVPDYSTTNIINKLNKK
ncbi:MAG: D-glycero-beta-D-manno-heptose 1-phosphate adenylyltransferase [bacterium]|nr:D-glycero-beta-D-manno-heptose 1-phosphate adenylyltransferase [bacterium]